MKIAIIGIDPDSKRLSAVVSRLDGKDFKVRQKILPNPKNDIGRWCDSAWLWVYRMTKELVNQGYEVHVFIEKPFVHPKRPSAAIPLSRLNGCMLAAASRAGAVTVLDVTIKTWKKEVCGNGGMSKPQIAMWCKVHWRNVWDEAQKVMKTKGRQDIIDAAAINRYGALILSKMKRNSKTRREVEHAEDDG